MKCKGIKGFLSGHNYQKILIKDYLPNRILELKCYTLALPISLEILKTKEYKIVCVRCGHDLEIQTPHKDSQRG